jgi:hypothetical protein
MLKSAIINEIAPKVEKAIIELFERAIVKQKNPNDFLLFLENGYLTDTPIKGFSPYVIGQGTAGIADVDRTEFFEMYVNTPFEKTYNKAKSLERKKSVYKHSLHLELMMYTHFWESYPNLKALKQLVNLVKGNDYEWLLVIPDFSRHEFIREGIRDSFKEEGLLIADIITKCYNSQLRNAFAHSQFTFWYTDRITLGNYHGKPWEKKYFTYDEWNEIFTTTSLLYNILVKQIFLYKRKIGESGNHLGVWIPNSRGHTLKYLSYDPNYNRYLWKANEKK